MSIYSLESAENPSEDLALSQLVEQEKEVKETGDYDLLHENSEELVKEDKEENADETSDDSSDDSSDDTETDENKDSEEDTDENADEDSEMDTSDDKIQTPVTESLRNEYYNRVVLEAIDFNDVKNGLNVVGSAIASGARFIADLVSVLTALEIKYYPTVAQFTKKTVIYLYTKAARLLLKTVMLAADFSKKHIKAISKRKEEIQSIREQIKELKSKGSLKLVQEKSTDDRVISWMTVNSKTDPITSVSTMTTFVDTVVDQIDKRLITDIEAVNKLIEFSKNGLTTSPFGFMSVSPFLTGFMRKETQYNGEADAVTESFVYHSVLPDQVMFVANIPKSSLRNIEDIAKAYHESGIFLTPDNKHPSIQAVVNYMDVEGVERFLDALDGLCDKALMHLKSYNEVVKKAKGLKFGYKHYYQKIVDDKGKSSVHDTLTEYVYLKQSFVSRVYLPAAMDIRDYVSSYLIQGLKLVKDNLEQLQEEKESSV